MTFAIDRALLQGVLDIAEQAGSAILKVYDAPGQVDVITKADDTPVTAADHAAHHVIVAGLQALTPQIPVLSEESEPVAFSQRSQWQRYWLVDPLDGTKEFINRTGEFTVNIALIDQHRPVLGVVTVPVKRQAYVGAQGVGAYRVDGGQWRSIAVRKVPTGALSIAGSRRHGAERLEPILRRIEAAGIEVSMTSMGSSLKFCLIAEGLADCYPRLGPTSEWDTAAAQAVLQEAGGQVVDTAFRPLAYNTKESLLNSEFYALGDADFPWSTYLA